MRISDWSSDVCSSDLHIAEVIVWIFKRRGHRSGRSIDLAIDEPPDRIPLPRRRRKPHIAVGRDPLALLNKLAAADLGIGEQPVVTVSAHQPVDRRRTVKNGKA